MYILPFQACIGGVRLFFERLHINWGDFGRAFGPNYPPGTHQAMVDKRTFERFLVLFLGIYVGN